MLTLPVIHRFLCSWPAVLAYGVLLSGPLAAQNAPSTAPKPMHAATALVSSSVTAMRSDPERSRRYAEEALTVLQKQPDADLEIRARLQLCDYYAERDRTAAEEQIRLANARLGAAHNAGLGAGILNCEGAIYETAGDNARARDLYERAVNVAQGKDQEMLAEALFSRGYIYALQGDYAQGLNDLKQSQELFEKLQMQAHALTALNSIAVLYNRLGSYEQAAQLLQRALAAQRAQRMRREEVVTLHNLARAQENLEDWKNARESFAVARTIAQQLKYARGEAYALRGLAAVANATGEPQLALTLLDQATALQARAPDARLQAQIELARGIALHLLQRLDQSAAALEQAQTTFSQANSLNELSMVYSELAAVYAEMGDWRKAYEIRSSAQTTSNRVLREQLDQRFATLKVEFDTATKEKENALLMRENEANQRALNQARTTRQWQTAVIVLTLLLMTVLGTLLWHQRRHRLRNHLLAMTDELTGVPNRRAVLRTLEQQLNRAGTTRCAILVIDIDHFKSINDQYGHPVGDETLKLVALELKRVSIGGASTGRLGGEEFIMVLPNSTLTSAARVAEQLRIAISGIDLSRWCGNRLITVSIGVALSRPFGDSPSTMLRRADAALYVAKNSGRNRVSAEPSDEVGAAQRLASAG